MRRSTPLFFAVNPIGTERAAIRRVMSLTREDLHTGLHRFATKHDLERFATKQELADLREATAQGFADLRRHVDLVAQDLASTIAVLLDGLAARIHAMDAQSVDAPRNLEDGSAGTRGAD